MKFAIPEIFWHNRDPVLSVDFQPRAVNKEPLRLATGGTDSHVVIWYISTTESGSVNIEVAADLTRHQKTVNVVRWSPNGQFLASGDDESIIFIWKQKNEEPAPVEQGEEQYKETWVIHKTLRGHVEDVLDLCWSPDSLHLASGSVDNKLLLWDMNRGKYSCILTDHKGFVQGVCWDPKGQLIVTASSDRVFRAFDIATKKVVSRSSKAVLPFPADHPLHSTSVRLYHDDMLQTYYRRLQFSPDGLLIAVPAGRIEPEQPKPDFKPMNAVYIYSRYSLKAPACVLPCGDPALVARWSPVRYTSRAGAPALPCPRMVLAVATKRSVLLYDTHQKTPIAIISNIHYTRLTDLTWSSDGNTLVASSTDGYCSVITFSNNELGEPLPQDTAQPSNEEPMEIQSEEPQVETAIEKPTEPQPTATTSSDPKPINKIDSFIKFKAPEKSPKNPKTDNSKKAQKTPVKLDVLVETAMPSWSDNSNNEIIKPKEIEKQEIMVIDDSEDMKLVYEDTANSQSPAKTEKSPEATNKETLTKQEETKKMESKTSPITKNISPERKRLSPKQVVTPTSSKGEGMMGNFLSQAKVTDVKQPISETGAPSPKAPRRVSFVTLSSPKNSKKKC